MKKRAILFDLDGTLWDSSREITDSWNEVLREQGRKPVSHEKITSLLGQPMDVFAREIYPDLSLEEGLEQLQRCMEYENDYLARNGAHLYPGLREVVSKLREDYFTAIVSNSQSGYIEAFLKAHHLEDLFDDKECFGNTLCYKDENIRRVIERNQIDEALYVGDIDSDRVASLKAGVPFVFASWGFGDVDTDRKIDSLRELPDMAGRVFAEKTVY